MKLALGFDHAGVKLKSALIEFLNANGYEYKDFGTYTEDSCNYAEYGAAVAEAVASGEFDRGILICGTGIGMSIVANKVPGIRCAHCQDVFSAKATRQHNDSNVLAFGERVVAKELALEIVKTFLETEFEGGRHCRRVDKFMDFENE